MRQSDVLASIDKYLHDKYDNIPIYSSRNLEEIQRNEKLRQRLDSYFGVGLIDRNNIIIGPASFIDRDRWAIVYAGKDEDNVRDTIDDLTDSLNFNNNVTGYLYNYSFPVPKVRVVEDTSSIIVAGEYDIAFTATKPNLNPDNPPYETKISKPFSLRGENELHGANSINIQFPKLPIAQTTFTGYNVYIRTEDNDNWMKIGSFEHQDRKYNLAVVITSFDIEEGNPPEFSLIPYKNMMVLKVAADISENYLEDGFWSGYVMIEVQSPDFREDPNDFILDSLGVTLRAKVIARGN